MSEVSQTILDALEKYQGELTVVSRTDSNAIEFGEFLIKNVVEHMYGYFRGEHQFVLKLEDSPTIRRFIAMYASQVRYGSDEARKRVSR